MPRKNGIIAQNNFIQGLITERTALTFPANAAIDTYNCVFKQQGNVQRRLGLSVEPSGFPFSTSYDLSLGQVYRTFIWEAVSGNGNTSFLVSQQGSNIYIYDISNSVTSISLTLHPHFINLFSFLPLNSSQSPQFHLCDFVSGNGDLIVVNSVCEPFYVSYDNVTSTFTETKFTIKYRDFDGAPDENLDSVRPAMGSVAALASNQPNHCYNLYNQGWGQSDALSQWDAIGAALPVLPSNQDQVSMFRLSETDSFDVTKLTSKSPGNSLAPKGHFILDAANPQRSVALIAEGVTGLGPITNDSVSEVSIAVGTFYSFGSLMNVRTASAYDSNITQTAAQATTNGVAALSTTIGKLFPSSKIIRRVVLYTSTTGIFNGPAGVGITYQVFGKVGVAPVSEVDGTLLSTVTSASSAGQQIINLNISTTTAYDYVWVRPTTAAVRNFFVAEVKFFEQADTQQRLSTNCFLTGRIFYAGVEGDGESNKIYFSQIAENPNQYGRCYQKNDPTNEYFFELLADDGGVVRILEAGTIVKLFTVRTSVIVFATNGIWSIGGSQGGFKATDYNIKKLTSLGTTSPQSIVDVKGIPVWWSEDGIYTMQYDPNYDSFSIVSLTQTTVKKFITDIPVVNRKYVKGTYDSLNEIIYWLYNDTSSLTSAGYYTYTKMLCLNTITKAFYPWSFDGTTKTIRGIRYMTDATHDSVGIVKLLTTYNPVAGFENTYYSEFRDTSYLDWGVTDYSSYFRTGYTIGGDATKFAQPNYMFVFLNTVENSSCFMHARYDFTNSGDSGKWSSVQQVYNPSLTLRDVNFRRLKVRGKGRALQFMFVSETGKPFDIIGWSTFESINSDL